MLLPFRTSENLSHKLNAMQQIYAKVGMGQNEAKLKHHIECSTNCIFTFSDSIADFVPLAAVPFLHLPLHQPRLHLGRVGELESFTAYMLEPCIGIMLVKGWAWESVQNPSPYLVSELMKLNLKTNPSKLTKDLETEIATKWCSIERMQ